MDQLKRFKEAAQIDIEPFDGDVLEEVYVRPYASEVYMTFPFAILVFRYFALFDQRYGTDIAGSGNVERLVGYSEDTEFWYEEASGLLDEAMRECGWCREIISSEYLDEFFEEMTDSEGNEASDEEKYLRFLDAGLCDGFLKDALREESKAALEMKNYMEFGYLVIVWNSALNKYMQFREKHPDMIETVCREEDRWIVELEKDIWEPYMAFYECGRKEVNGQAYSKIVLGCTGDSYVAFEAINPNWLCKAVKLDKMLQLANEKLACFQAGRESGSAA